VLLKLKLQGRAKGTPEAAVRPGALAVSLGFGGVVALLLLVSVAVPFDPALSQFFAEQSVPTAYGRNVVNVVLVDFRALDTLGEITVVMLSFLAALPLLQAVRQHRSTQRDKQKNTLGESAA
jgi:multicomponent Na+:H+ antiporter subunit A